MHVTGSIYIDENELIEQFVRAGGPGGQNVNKVSTAVQLRFNVKKSPSLSDEVRHRLLSLGGRKITREGVLVIDARRFRTQDQNRRDARERLIELVRQAAKKPRVRISTKPSFSSRKKGMENKRRKGQLKKLRTVKPSNEY